MPVSLRRGRVSAIVEASGELVRLEVDEAPCVAYPRITGPVEAGDEVVVNVQARELGLGSGGFDILYVNLTRGLGLAPPPGAHVMTLPYTPAQAAVLHAEEHGGSSGNLAGTPVVCCTLHSQLAPVCAGLGGGIRVAYLQLPGGALPVSLSDTVRALKRKGLLEVSVAVSPCLDGDVQCVSIYSALAWAAASGFDAVVCGVGPGIVGTASTLGHGGLAATQAANAASALEGSPILAVRVSTQESRERHRGVSHHTKAVLELCLGDVLAAWPGNLTAPDWLVPRREVEIEGWEGAVAGLPLEHMGRGPDEDPWFFASALAAGKLARSLLR